jgi:hypothetical protein
MPERLTGQCLCGACRFSATPEAMESGACHCGMCRHWSGGVFMSVGCGSSVEFEDEAQLGHYRASQWGERVFCKQCGSSLLWQTQDGKFQHVSAQAFDNPGDFALKLEVFYDQKPASYDFANDTKKMTEAEVFAMFAPPPGDQAS